MRSTSLPDPDAALRQYTDFIMGSRLCRRALLKPEPPALANFVRDFLEEVYALQQSCHLPEFTDHGLSHLCSLVSRISGWELPLRDSSVSTAADKITPDEAAVLLLGILFHDIGMLSQRPEDMPLDSEMRGVPRMNDIASWVRETHIQRMRRLILRVMSGKADQATLECETVERAFRVAQAHGSWPENWGRLRIDGRDAGIAGLLAVADLWDEDSVRCDTSTLIAHRHGTALNHAHWLRHSLTVAPVEIASDSISVELGRLPDTDETMLPVYGALRNHFRLAALYSDALRNIDIQLRLLRFAPETGLPTRTTDAGKGWQTIPGYSTQPALLFHLLRSFMPEALLNDRALQPELLERLRHLGLEPVDLSSVRGIPGFVEGRSEEEQAFRALMSTKIE